ncbi:MAG: pilI [Paucimonas sp.]|nr:pilI [Paucimonas sp.]
MPPTPDTLSSATQDQGTRRRTRLREFQAQLVERMQAARAGADTRVNQLGIEIGAQRWLVNLAHAGELTPVGGITPVPLTKDWFLGVTNLRGNLVSVIDLARFLGGAPTVPGKESRILAFAPALNFNAALLVTRVLGLRNMAQMQAQPLARAEPLPWSQDRYVDAEGQHWQQLDLSVVIRDPAFLQVGM